MINTITLLPEHLEDGIFVVRVDQVTGFEDIWAKVKSFKVGTLIPYHEIRNVPAPMFHSDKLTNEFEAQLKAKLDAQLVDITD